MIKIIHVILESPMCPCVPWAPNIKNCVRPLHCFSLKHVSRMMSVSFFFTDNHVVNFTHINFPLSTMFRFQCYDHRDSIASKF